MRKMNRLRRGFTLIELLVAIAVISVVMAIALPAVQMAREAARKTTCKNNLKQIGIALQGYQETHESLPSGYIYGGQTQTTAAVPSNVSSYIFDAPPPTPQFLPNGPGWSWIALSLQHLGQSALHQSIDFGVPCEDPSQESIRLMSLADVSCPSDTELARFTVFDEINVELADAYPTSYAACFGSFGLMNTDPDNGSGVFQRNSRIRSTDIRDGMSQTIAIGERAAKLTRAPWVGVMTGGTVRTTPGAPAFGAVIELAPAMSLARVGNRTLNSPYSEPYDFFSPHRTVVFFLFADGSVKGLSTSMEHSILHALATRDGGEVHGEF